MKIIKEDKYHQIIFGVQTIGRDALDVNKTAPFLKEKIYVPKKMKKIYGLLGLSDNLFTSEKRESHTDQSLRPITHYFNMKEIPTIANTAPGVLENNFRPFKEEDDLIQKSFGSDEIFHECNIVAEIPRNLNESIMDDSLQPNNSAEPALFDAHPAEETLKNYSGEEDNLDEFLQLEKTLLDEERANGMTPLQRAIPSPDQLENVLNEAGKLIDSINSDLDQYQDDHIYSDPFIDKLLTLTRLYEPLTGVTMKY